MKEGDLPYILEIENVSFPNPWHEITFRGEIYNQPISYPFVIIFKPQKKIIGYLVFWQIKERMQINNIAIHPDYRRMGIAEAVLHQVLSEVRMGEIKFVTLEVRPSNIAARTLYNKLGFDVLGIKENYYHDPPEPALVMGKKLT
ncbi:MAG: ribosomal protein S18-alanine N-acetyltransferase [Candidatus Aminicenantes bacterium]|jgi:ribosomal-protein-alanine N-acetyltransferase|nr:ribosomal protein S18-alanine N-acetyltransferase [Candidatus Aminicenantes bacterium]